MADMRDTIEEDVQATQLAEAAEDERRRARRRHLTVPVRIDTTSRPERFAITRNLSRTGALLATPSRFRIGAKAVLLFHARSRGERSPVAARIVRLELNPEDATGLWPYLAAVAFETPLESSISLVPDVAAVR